MTFAGKYAIYYRHDEACITIYRVMHQRRDIDDFILVNLSSLS